MICVTPSFNNLYTTTSFKKNRQAVKSPADDNPISRGGEVMNLIKTTFVGGLAMGAYLLAEIVEDGDFLLDDIIDYSKKTANANSKKEVNKLKQELEKKKKAVKDNKILKSIGIFTALVAAFISGFALLYTAFHAPNIAYESKVNTFKKSKEMDVYIKANEAERELYTQLDERAKNSTPEEKEQLKVQYMQMRNAKNQVPDFVKL